MDHDSTESKKDLLKGTESVRGRTIQNSAMGEKVTGAGNDIHRLS